MDLSRVTSIRIPEGDVVKIEHGGIVLWQQETEATTFDGYGVVEFSGRGSKVLKSATFFGESVKYEDVIKSNNSKWRATSGSIVDLSAIILRSVYNVSDEFESISGKLTRKVYQYTFNGNETVTTQGTYTNTKSVSFLPADGGLPAMPTVGNVWSADGFEAVGIPKKASALDEVHIVRRYSSFYIFYPKSYRSFKEYINSIGSPITVIYELKTPTEEHLTPQPIMQLSGYNAIRQTSGDLLGSHLTVEAFGTAVTSYTVEISGDAVLSHLGEDAIINKIGFLDPAGSLVKMIDLRPGGDDFDEDPTIPYQMIDGVGSIYLYALEDTQDVTVTLQLSGGADIIKTLPSRDQSTDLTFPISSDLDITGVSFTT